LASRSKVHCHWVWHPPPLLSGEQCSRPSSQVPSDNVRLTTMYISR
jgi:hypothetical protein